MKHGNNVRSQTKRLTIGYIAQGIFDDVSQVLWTGVVDVARERSVNLITFPGYRLKDPRGAPSPVNIVYELARDGFLDGLVNWASSVAGALNYE